MLLCKKLNNYLDRQLRPEVRLFNKTLSSFNVLGYSGLLLAILLTMTLVTLQGLSPWVMAGIILTAVSTFFGLAMMTKIVTGEESLVYYHHEIAVMAAAAIILRLMHNPVLLYLDILILGIGLFLVFGRIGCLMVGCCHGRPHHCGISYGQQHKEAGFTRYFVGVRLFPIQALESLWVLSVVTVGSAFVLWGDPPGEALAWYVMAYGVGRFSFEFFRGDPERPYLFGFSEAQWTTLLLMAAIIWAEFSGTIPFHLWHAGATTCLVLGMIVLSLIRNLQKTNDFKLLHPHHIEEIAEALDRVSGLTTAGEEGTKGTPVSGKIPISCTSLGIQISANKIKSDAGVIYQYTFSCKNGLMSEKITKKLSKLILKLRHPSSASELIVGDRGVRHLLVCPDLAIN